MVQLNWSMTILGYPRHQRGSSAVVGLSHMSTHEVLRFAEELNLYTGWLLAEGSQPQIERIRPGLPVWVALAEMFADRRIVKTEGIASGKLTYVAAVPASGQPPTDRPLTAWADERQLPWVQIIDNEIAYWGGLQDAQVDRLFVWFCCRRPIECDWRISSCDARIAGRVRAGLFDHGWTRNLGLVKTSRKPSLDLWGGVHSSCALDHAQRPVPSQCHTGLRLTLQGAIWQGTDINDRCLLNDETGKLPLNR